MWRAKRLNGVRDIPEGVPTEEEGEHDFTEVLPEVARAEGFQLFTEEKKYPNGSYYLRSLLVDPEGKVAGRIEGAVRTNGSYSFVTADDTRLNVTHRGRGLGKAMYEALYRRGFELGAMRVKGGSHSADAHGVHESLNWKHDWSYDAYPYGDDEEDEPKTYSPYEHQLTGAGLGVYQDERAPQWLGFREDDFEVLELKDANGRNLVPLITVIHATTGGPNRLVWFSFDVGFSTFTAKVELDLQPSFLQHGGYHSLTLGGARSSPFRPWRIKFKLKREALEKLSVWLDRQEERGALFGVKQESVSDTYSFITFDKVKFTPNETMRNWNARTSSRVTTFTITRPGSKGFETSTFCIANKCWYLSGDIFKSLLRLAEGKPSTIGNDSFAMELRPEDRASFVLWLKQVVEKGIFFRGQRSLDENGYARFLVWADSVLEKTSFSGLKKVQGERGRPGVIS
jgi:hypothetical protein